MNKAAKSFFVILLYVLTVSAGSAYADHTVSYDQVIQPSFGPEIHMKVWMKDNLFRSETEVSGQKIITIRNDSGTYSYLPAQKMATKIPHTDISGNYIKYPEKYKNYIRLLGAKSLGYDKVEGEDCEIFKYEEKESGSVVTSYVSLKKKLPVKMTVENSFGKSDILFKDMQLGQDLPDNLFTIPEGVTVIDPGALLKNR